MMFGYTDPHDQVQPPAGFPAAQGPYPFPVPQESAGGPLAGMQDSIASVLNASDQSHVYIPTGEANPIVTVPGTSRPRCTASVAAAPLPGRLCDSRQGPSFSWPSGCSPCSAQSA